MRQSSSQPDRSDSEGAGTEASAAELAITLLVNGSEVRLKVLPGHTLLDVLRSRLKLMSVREGCGIGMCGTCTVLLDDRPVSACLQFAALAEGRRITTLEGLTDDGQLHPVQQAFLEQTAFQCSYCTPGFVLATVGLLTEIDDPSEEEIKEYLSGNLCRCGSYIKILAAVRAATKRRHRQISTAPNTR